jgi:vacuolar-type H+-ATPase subunit H
MAKETVQAVRQAELNAAQREREAIQKKETLISEAQLNAKTIVSSMSKEALEKAERNLALANERGIEIMEAAKLKAEKEVLLMKEMAQSKEEAAINMVLSNVIKETI